MATQANFTRSGFTSKLDLSRRVVFLTASLVAALNLMAIAGCGGGGPEIVPVSGLITVDGKPFGAARINTQPKAASMEDPNPGPGSFGVTGEDGRYFLEVATDGQEGAVVGTHSVTIVMEEDAFSDDPTYDGYQPPSRVLPRWFTDGSLIIEIPVGGTESADLELSTKAPPS